MLKSLSKQEEIELYEYTASLVKCDRVAGVITWKVRKGNDRLTKTWNTRYSGKECGRLSKEGYRVMCVNYRGKQFSIFVHKVIWFSVHGYLPNEFIDHINQNRADNRLLNLREVSSAQNNKNRKLTSNNTSGVVGVQFDKQRGKWKAVVTVNYKVHYLGYFDDINEAESVVKAFRSEHGFTNSHGSK